jgi:hypothetical protein
VSVLKIFGGFMMYPTLTSFRLGEARSQSRRQREDQLSSPELAFREELITTRQADCRMALRHPESAADRHFIQGAIAGLEDCRGCSTLSALEQRLKQLATEESRTTTLDLSQVSFRPSLDKPLDLKELWEIKGKRAQTEYVLESLRDFRRRTGLSGRRNETLARTEG